MKKALLLAAVLAVLLLSACAGEPALPSVPETTLPTCEPATLPTETVPPTQPPLPAGPAVFLQGAETESFLFENAVYVRQTDFAAALPVEGKAATLAAVTLHRDDGDYVPVLALSQALGYGILTYEETGEIYVTPAAGMRSVPQGISVPILMYHAVSDDTWGVKELFVSPEDMEDQLAYLTENGFDPIFFSDLAHLEDYDKPVILTFDDGYCDNYTNLYPLLQKYQAKATIFVVTGTLGWNHKMTSDQVQELSRSGLVSIQSHTVTHPSLGKLKEDDLIREMTQSRLALTRLTGLQPEVLCYPYGSSSALVEKVAARYYSYGLIMSPGGYETGDDAYSIGRYYVARSTTLHQFANMVADAGEKS